MYYARGFRYFRHSCLNPKKAFWQFPAIRGRSCARPFLSFSSSHAWRVTAPTKYSFRSCRKGSIRSGLKFLWPKRSRHLFQSGHRRPDTGAFGRALGLVPALRTTGHPMDLVRAPPMPYRKLQQRAPRPTSKRHFCDSWKTPCAIRKFMFAHVIQIYYRQASLSIQAKKPLPRLFIHPVLTPLV